MNKHSIGSLFDGSGGFPLASALCGIEPRWASEVEPYPIAVTRSRFPDMKHLGDITKVNGAEIEPVDVITFGSPCQDLSVAGRQAGMKHESNGDATTTRSGLFMEAVRIIKEMRRATNDEYPKFAVWENVPGAFSSNRGEDFHTVLQEIIQIVEPTSPPLPSPEKGGWAYADVIVGDGWSIAYRVFDTQYWPRTPQRRRRIYLVADFTGGRAGKILFEREGLRGDFAESGTPWQGAPAEAQGRTGVSSRTVASCYGISAYESNAMKSSNPHSGIYEADTSRTIDVNCGNPSCNQGGIAVVEAVCYQDKVGALCARDYKGVSSQYVTEEKLIVETKPRYIVRRLTPTECARLQGFPDWWANVEPKDTLTDSEHRFWTDVRNTHAAINGRRVRDYTKEQMLAWYNKLHSDSAEYKMWGNGIALPPTLYVMQGIADALNERAA